MSKSWIKPEGRKVSVNFEGGKVETDFFGHHSTNKVLGYFLAGIFGLIAAIILTVSVLIVAVVFNVAVFFAPLLELSIQFFLMLLLAVMALAAIVTVLSIPLNFVLQKLGREGFLNITPDSFSYVLSMKGFRKRSS